MQTGYVISDLHMFARWSWADRYIDRMHAAAGEADFFVLNGDIFDFRWTTMPSIAHSVDAAVDWLGEFAAAHPDCTVYYVLGNHDGFAGLADRVALLAGETDNFDWRPAYLRMGGVLFTHGDLFWRKGRNPFERRLAATARRISPAIGWVYHLVHTIRCTRIFNMMWRARRCVRRIVRSLADAPAGLTDGITDIYCGHTHVAVSDFAVKADGLTFHNTGSGIKHLRCNMCRVSIPNGGTVST